MKKPINILMIDDHPFIIEAYKNVLADYNPSEYEIKITTATNCETGYHAISNILDKGSFDIAFLDISMPPYEEKKIFSGEDLAVFIKNKMPKCNIILLTMHTEALKVSNIIKTVNPEGLIVKNDLTFDELRFGFQKILKGERYYSHVVMNIVLTMVNNAFTFDSCDQQIIYFLSKGVKTKNIPEHVYLSLSAVEKRKLQIKEFFKIRGGNDEDIIREAKKYGFL